MAYIGVIAPRHAAPGARLGGWRGFGSLPRRRWRKPLVAASLVAGDVLCAWAAMSLTVAALAATGLPAVYDRRPTSIAFLIGAFFIARLYSAWGPSPCERLRTRALCIAAFPLVDVIAQPFVPHGLAPLLLAALFNGGCLLVLGHYTEAAVRAVMIRLGLWGARAAIVACDEQSRRLAAMLAERQDLGLSPIGFIQTARDSDAQKQQLPFPLVGSTADPLGIEPAVEIVLAGSQEDLATMIESPRASVSPEFLLIGNAHDVQNLWVRTRALGDTTAIEIRRDLCRPHNRVLKRATDVLLSVVIAIPAILVVAVLALAVKLIDAGPAFYVHGRVGRNGQTVRVLKLRTMYADAEERLEEHLLRDPQARLEWQRFFKLDRDPRILPVIGAFIRRTSLDELPQLWNVIRGDMSLVGPRPFPSYHMSSFDAEFQVIRTSVPPGITGMWQISSRSNGDLETQKAQDLFYIRNWSLWLDIYILLETLPAVLLAKGAK
jgi:Undecaprenyl-phosphate galactose phosphotransferase WbaP